jgi:hypothetical protein
MGRGLRDAKAPCPKDATLERSRGDLARRASTTCRPVVNAAAEFGRQIREDLERWGRLVRETNLKIEQRGGAVAQSRAHARRPPRVAPGLRGDDRSVHPRSRSRLGLSAGSARDTILELGAMNIGPVGGTPLPP